MRLSGLHCFSGRLKGSGPMFAVSGVGTTADNWPRALILVLVGPSASPRGQEKRAVVRLIPHVSKSMNSDGKSPLVME